jgi:hypothetical protein
VCCGGHSLRGVWLLQVCKSCNASKQAKPLFNGWDPSNMTDEMRAELAQQIGDLLVKYSLK